MKKFLISLIIASMVSTGIVFAENIICEIGANLVQDPYNKKIFVLKLLPNSSALEYNLPEGTEILAVNDKKN